MISRTTNTHNNWDLMSWVKFLCLYPPRSDVTYLDLVTVTCGNLSIDHSDTRYSLEPVNGIYEEFGYPVGTEAYIHCYPKYGLQGPRYPGFSVGASICMANGTSGYWSQPPQCIKSNEHLPNFKYHFWVFHETPLE